MFLVMPINYRITNYIIVFCWITSTFSYYNKNCLTVLKSAPIHAKKDLDMKPSRPKRKISIEESSSVQRDPWKVLIKKLDSTKQSQIKFGKVEKSEPLMNQFDEMKCPHFDTCAGCIIKGVSSFNVKIGPHNGWRTHAKLAVQPLSRWGGLKIGLYKAGSHEIEAIPDCRVHHPRINEAVEEVRRAATDAGVKAYQPATKGLSSSGDLRYLQLTVERESGKVQLVLVWNADMYREADQSLNRFAKRLKQRPDLWHSISVNFQTAETNVIFNPLPKSWKLVWGPPAAREQIGRAAFFFRPQVFRQANLDMFERGIIPAVEAAVPAQASVAELYSGLGVIGLNMAHKAKEVLCSDRDSTGAADEMFDKCADSLPESEADRVFYEPLSASEAVEQGQLEKAEVLIVDPPRRGLDREVLQALLGVHPTAQSKELRRLIYVSCGFEALQKDITELMASRRWKLVSAEGFAMFPGSDHIETVAVLDRM